jgi:DnaJ-class molecular chaperone
MALEYKDYYKILGVDKNADDKAIKQAYRRLARKYHPDLNKNKGSAERFKEINEANEVLSDPEKRRKYDTLGPDWQRYAQAGGGPGEQGPFPGGFRVEYSGAPGGEPGGFSDFFRTLFGGGRGGFDSDVFEPFRRGSGSADRARGQDVQAGTEISLDEAFRGTRKTFSMELEEPCATCGGAGHTDGRPCSSCGGHGWQRTRRDLDVKIPAGVKTGSRIRVSGEGAGGPGGGGVRGDLYLTVTVSPHPLFDRRGDDLHVELPVTTPEAALGATIDVPSLKGKVSMKLPAGTSSGRTFRLRGYGMPRVKGAGAGDQLVKIKIVLPSALTDEERALYERLKALRNDNPRAYLG